jgi:uncharacterized circularly permuted ATP-grasp superfamily protein/uncharacterized alpha-E superfamily protein
MRAVTPASLGTERYDEFRLADGTVRAHWQPLVERLTAGSAARSMRQSLDLTRRLVVEKGVTYNIYADPKGADRPWALDALPLLLTDAEWRQIEAGVAQRARLLDAVLADLYGPQRLLAEGLVPTELPFGHPNFLWPCVGLQPAGNRWLHSYAADLARAPDGRWWLLADRTQAPSGAGYALENREILEQVHPELIRDLGVRRVHGFFGELAEGLFPGTARQDSLAVILTPGPYNETFFEHAYLARQLGLPLVEGHDLTVRADIVYLKTIDGLRRVHAILRRLDDDYCDPLELRSDSALGVPGLIGALRAGNVLVSNAPGTGVLESAAWLGFLPAIAERLLGEKLLLPEVATWWCGERPALEYVLANLDHLVIKPAYPNQRFEPMFGREFTGTARERLVQRLRARPYAYVAQEHVPLSQAPVWQTAGTPGFASRALSIRVHAIATSQGVRVLPGGLARIAPEGATDVVSTQRGGGGKDIWVLGDAAVPSVAPAEASGRWSQLGRFAVTPSRLVENLYWLGRYTVRCEDKARILRSTLAVRVDAAVWRHALDYCHATGAVAEGIDPGRALRDSADPHGLPADVRRLAASASQARNSISARHWRGVIDLQRQVQEAAASRSGARETLDKLLLALAALTGFMEEDMAHDAGWRLTRLGRRIERLYFIADLLARHLRSDAPMPNGVADWLLEVCDSRNVYRARYRDIAYTAALLDLLLRDTGHPLSLAFLHHSISRDVGQFAALLGVEREAALADLPHPDDAGLQLLEAAGTAGSAARLALADRLSALCDSAAALSNRLTRRLFSHVEDDAQALAT